jgi:hypothetical protein
MIFSMAFCFGEEGIHKSRDKSMIIGYIVALDSVLMNHLVYLHGKSFEFKGDDVVVHEYVIDRHLKKYMFDNLEEMIINIEKIDNKVDFSPEELASFDYLLSPVGLRMYESIRRDLKIKHSDEQIRINVERILNVNDLSGELVKELFKKRSFADSLVP